ncbi:hypothetical protein ACWGDT_39620 [Streptomyces avermitilis]
MSSLQDHADSLQRSAGHRAPVLDSRPATTATRVVARLQRERTK